MAYAHALAKLEEERLSKNILALSLAENKNQLLSRIKRIVGKSAKKYSGRDKLKPLALLLLLAVCMSWITIKKDLPEKPTSEQKISIQNSEKLNLGDKTISTKAPDGKKNERKVDVKKENLIAGPKSVTPSTEDLIKSISISGDEETDKILLQLKAQLNSPSSRVRTDAVTSLSKFKIDTVSTWIATALSTDSSKHVRQTAAYALDEFNNQVVVNSLLKALDDPNEQVQQAAIESITSIGDKSATEPIVSKLESSNPIIRHVALMGAVKLLDDESLEPLLTKALQDENRVVRDFAKYNLDRMKR
jgi:hypothetical protein